MRLTGGRQAFSRRLDDFFAYRKLLVDPSATARTDWITSPYDYYAKPTYNPNNEPDLLAPYMYHWAGEPAKTATVVRAAMTLFTTGPDGMTGNDDLGTMSAWYVFSSLGLYPTMSGANFLAVSSPQFPAALVAVAGHALKITAPGVSDANRYIQRVKVNGRSLSRNWIPWSAIGSGGTIAHVVGSAPSAWGTQVADQPPSVDRAPPDGRTALSAAVRPSSVALAPGGSVGVTVDLVGQAPGVLRPHVSAVVPAGWRVSVRQPGPLRSRHLPVSSSAAISVTAPVGVEAGSYPLAVTVTGGPQPVPVSGSLVVTAPLSCSDAVSGGCAVGLTPALSRDGTATVASPGSGDFDGGGWSFDADLLPAAGPVTWDGVTYLAPDPTGTAKNFVQAVGQALLLPVAARSALHLVVTSHNGPVGGALTVGYTDGTYTEVPLTVADWCGAPAAGTTAVLAMDHRIKAGQGVDGPAVSLFGVTVPLEAGKQVRSLTLPDEPRMYVYAATLT